MPTDHHAEAYAALVAAHCDLAESHYRAGAFSAGLRVLESGDQLLRDAPTGDAPLPIRGRLALALGALHVQRAFQWHRGFDGVLIALERANALAEACADPALLAGARDTFGLARYYQIRQTGAGSYEQPLEEFRAALAQREELGDMRGVAESAFHVGLANERLGRVAEARAAYERARALAERHGHLVELSYAARHLGGLAADTGDLDQALALFERSLALREQTGYVVLLPLAHQAVGDVLAAKGDAAGAEEHYRRAVELALAMETPLSQVSTLTALAGLLWGRGRADDARPFEERARTIAAETGVSLPRLP